MKTTSHIETWHEWISRIAQKCPSIFTLELHKSVKNGKLNADAFNLANSDYHEIFIAESLELISKIAETADFNILTKELFSRNCVGAFSEIIAYNWLITRKFYLQLQIPIAGNDILSKNGATLDGSFNHRHQTIYFDIKSFSLTNAVANKLKMDIEELLFDSEVQILDSWDVPVSAFEKLLEKTKEISSKLKNQSIYKSGKITITSKPKKGVSVSSRIYDPYLLAEENSTFALKHAHKFTINSSFILIFVSHPWFGGALSHDFNNSSKTLTHALSRRSFIQYKNCISSIAEISDKARKEFSTGYASSLLSGILYIDAEPLTKGNYISQCFLYSNPNAKTPINIYNFNNQLKEDGFPTIHIADFTHDNY
ncbi:hypothetical protein ACFFU8_15830 [Chromobacterium piscinae]|uniref:hypothetical protein n=1 Tax=Chromobacterium piscinae TaxID=686831 RepID=UPI001E5EC154|nr:hypothetical protein [Chromobacterium piscinae]MCD5329622.1 hypothetical protein [Chromobacterium piscinae]